MGCAGSNEDFLLDDLPTAEDVLWDSTIFVLSTRLCCSRVFSFLW